MDDEKLALGRALVKLAGLVKDPSMLEDPLYLIRVGAQAQIPIYWRNSDQICTRLSDFKRELKDTDSFSRWLQLDPYDVSKLETAQYTEVQSFALTSEDWAILPSTPPMRKVKGKTVFLGAPGFRHEVNYKSVKVARDQLFVNLSDLQDHAASLAAAPEPSAPAPANQRGTAQNDAIIFEIKKQKLDPLALPQNQPGKAGVKAAIRAALVGKTPSFPKVGEQFKKAWERLLAAKDIAYKK